MVGDLDDELRARRHGGSGHRSVPHTADAQVRAWGPTREACLAEAVLGMIECFAEVSGVRPTAVERVRLAPGSDEDLLVGLLDEFVFRLEVTGRIPVDVEVETAEEDDGGLDVRSAVAELDQVEIIGAVPKGISWQGLHIGPDPYGWSCTAIVDV
ncbi:archease [Streptomyces sp. NPDC003943]